MNSQYHHLTYKAFMRETGIVASITAIILGLSGYSMTREFVKSVAMPLFHGMRLWEKPTLHIGDFIGSGMVFLLSIMIAAILIKTFQLNKKHIPYVRMQKSESD